MNAVQTKNSILAGVAAVGAFVANALGGWDTMLKLLVALMVADYATGLLLAAVWKKSNKSDSGALTSDASFKGIVRKCVILLLVYIGVLLDSATGAQYVRSAIIIFFIGNEGLSLLENIGLMGVKYPAFLKNMLQALHDRGDEGDGKDAAR